MSKDQGVIVLMGSGELTSTMVEVHKALLRPYGKSPKAVFVDTPAGFQLNVDQIYQKAAEYFSKRIQTPLVLASYKTARGEDHSVAEQDACATLRKADYILIGPGSPTYALQQWMKGPIPNLMIDLVKNGGCLVAASAAALTVGCATLPVYEIYKVGQPVHWVEGLDILGHFGFNLVVIPHWNNAEGGNHDTRYCFMGASRLAQLEEMLAEASTILGLDEHTALIIDLAKQHATIEGIGQVTVRRQGMDWTFNKGDLLPLALLRGEDPAEKTGQAPKPRAKDLDDDPGGEGGDVWPAIHKLATSARRALDFGRDETVAGHVLALERLIWKSQRKLEEINEMGAAREVMREIITLLTAEMISRPANKRACMAPLIQAMIGLREQFRAQKEWAAADAVRDSLLKASISISDTAQGTTWSLVDDEIS